MPSTRKASSSAQPSSSSTSIKRSTRSTRSAPKRSPSPATLEAQLHLAGSKLFLAASKSPLEALKALLNSGNCPIWYQDPETGWSALHFAAERGDPDLVRLLLQNGAVWNAIDNLGYTAGDISLSVNDQESYLLIRDEGLRTEMIIHALQPASSSGDEPADDIDDMDQDVSVDSEKVTDTATLTENGMTLRNEDKSSAGDNMVFLQSKLVWEKGDDGVDRVLDGDGNGVMMGWETPLMRAHVDAMCKQHPQSGKGLSILNVGFGLGIIDTMFQEISPPPTHHAIIEAHPSVLSHIRSTGFDKRENVTMLEGRWQDWLSPKLPEKFAKLLESTPDGAGFDLIFVDTFAEGYSDLKAFFEFLPDLLKGPDAVFSFWNGLGATNALIYDVASNLAELHLDGVGMTTTWQDVPVDDPTSEVTWKGVKRKYWTMPVYKLPIARMSI